MLTHSIRWRLQIWLAILLVGMLAAFGVTSWQLEKRQRVQRLDDELARRAVALGVSIRPPDPPFMSNRIPSSESGPGNSRRRPSPDEKMGFDDREDEFGP
ncbi:MAG: hypothetical protein EOP83_34085, partial [Verrucomicrobiaceae bacterium]